MPTFQPVEPDDPTLEGAAPARPREDAGEAGPRRQVVSPGAPHDAVTVDGLPRSSSTSPSTTAGVRLGRYLLKSRLGAGGMGEVWEAEQDNPRRTVALKVVRADATTPQLLRRFAKEAEILGRLEHPNIARIYDAGTAEGAHGPVPYFAMELVRGLPLLEHADSKKLGRNARLALLATIARAVQHAHGQGVIHRDLKPGNILVDETGEPKILDFGVARVTDADMAGGTLATAFGEIVGTVQYMSPEQVAADPTRIDERVDVYALGVIGYQLLTGKLPHDVRGRPLVEALRMISEEEPTALGLVDRTLRGDVETLIGKALEKDPQQRYASAAALADDIERHLRDEPIAARPPSTAYMLAKFARRNRGLVAGVAAVFVALLAGLLGTTWGLARALAARSLAEQRRGEAEVARDAQRDEADKARATNDFLVNELLGAADPDLAQGREITVREILTSASEKIGVAFPRQPLVEAALRGTLGKSWSGLGDFAQAQQHFRAQLALAEAVAGPDSQEAVDALNNLSSSLGETGLFDEEDPLTQRLVERARLVTGPLSLSTARALRERGACLTQMGRLDEGEAALRESVATFYRVVGPLNPETLGAQRVLTTVLHQQGRLDEAVSLLRELPPCWAELGTPDHPEALRAANSLASLLVTLDQHDEAEELLRRTTEAESRVLGAAHPSTLATMNNLATLLYGRGRAAEAVELARTVHALQVEALGPEHPQALVSLNNLGMMLEDAGRVEEAEAVERDVVRQREKVLGRDHPATIASLNNLAGLLLATGRVAEAERHYQDACERGRRVMGAGHPHVGIFENNLGDALMQLGRHAEAAPLLERSREVIEKSFGATHARTLKAWGRLARLYSAQGRDADAAAALAKATPAGG